MKKEIQIDSIKIGGTNLPKILGVLNISPESFFSDSFTPCNKILHRAEELRCDGADILDLGARSTTPNAKPISVQVEKERIISSLKELEGCGIPISLDTMHADVLKAALRYDLDLINDISGLSNEKYARIVADSGLPVIAMATRKVPGDSINAATTHQSLKLILARKEKYGIENIILDPGIGKWIHERGSATDWELCQKFEELNRYGYPVLAAVSRKLFIGEELQKPAQDRLFGSLAVLSHLMEKGADLLRVHDVAATRDFITVFARLHKEDYSL
ncbi:MAG TPA: dihydropteroate synthase [Methanocorpusculum sp.]|nr:dihydropteroate synthase [Methanocorpusculum sp.]